MINKKKKKKKNIQKDVLGQYQIHTFRIELLFRVSKLTHGGDVVSPDPNEVTPAS